MNTTILIAIYKPFEMGISKTYMVGAIIAIFILGYLLYSLVKPDKF